MVSNTAKAFILSSAIMSGATAFVPAYSLNFNPNAVTQHSLADAAHKGATRKADKLITQSNGAVVLRTGIITHPANERPPVGPHERTMSMYDVRMNTDTTAMTETQLASYKQHEQHLSDSLPKSKGKSLEEHCLTCPSPLMPATVYHLNGDGKKLHSSVQSLDPKEKCARFTNGYEACLLPGESLRVDQHLTRQQRAQIEAHTAKYGLYVQTDKSLSREQRSAIQHIWSDGKATDVELLDYMDILPKNDKGMPYAAAKLIPRFSVPGSEPCEYVIKVRADLCEMPKKELPPPVVETPPAPVPATPIPEKPIVVVPPRPEAPIVVRPETPVSTPSVYGRFLYGTSGLSSTMNWNKLPNDNCNTPSCTAAFANHELSGKTYGIEVGYVKPHAKIALEAEKTNLNVDMFSASHASFAKFFDVRKLEEQSLTLKARGAIPTERPVTLYGAGELTKGQRTMSDATTSRTDDVNAKELDAGVLVGKMNGTHGYIGGGYRIFDLPHLMTAPTYNQKVPATMEVRTPVAEAGGQLSLFNKRLDLFADAKYLLNQKADVKLEDNLALKAGLNLWIDNSGKFQWGLTGDYTKKDPVKLNMPGNPAYMQNLVPKDTIRAGVTIRF